MPPRIKIANQKNVLESLHDVSDDFYLAAISAASPREYRVHQGKNSKMSQNINYLLANGKAVHKAGTFIHTITLFPGHPMRSPGAKLCIRCARNTL
jgi:hypothetical protein